MSNAFVKTRALRNELLGLTYCLLLIVSLHLLPAAATAQSKMPTASRKADLQVGGGIAYADPDYYRRAKGFTLYSTLDFKTHFGLELDFHQVYGPAETYERTYEIGGRYVLHYANNRINPYARGMYGRGVFNFPQSIANLAYNMAVIGGGVDIAVQKHVNVRVDYEYEKWFGFPPHGLTPQLATVGAAYHF